MINRDSLFIFNTMIEKIINNKVYFEMNDGYLFQKVESNKVKQLLKDNIEVYLIHNDNSESLVSIEDSINENYNYGIEINKLQNILIDINKSTVNLWDNDLINNYECVIIGDWLKKLIDLSNEI